MPVAATATLVKLQSLKVAKRTEAQSTVSNKSRPGRFSKVFFATSLRRARPHAMPTSNAFGVVMRPYTSTVLSKVCVRLIRTVMEARGGLTRKVDRFSPVQTKFEPQNPTWVPMGTKAMPPPSWYRVAPSRPPSAPSAHARTPSQPRRTGALSRPHSRPQSAPAATSSGQLTKRAHPPLPRPPAAARPQSAGSIRVASADLKLEMLTERPQVSRSPSRVTVQLADMGAVPNMSPMSRAGSMPTLSPSRPVQPNGAVQPMVSFGRPSDLQSVRSAVESMRSNRTRASTTDTRQGKTDPYHERLANTYFRLIHEDPQGTKGPVAVRYSASTKTHEALVVNGVDRFEIQALGQSPLRSRPEHKENQAKVRSSSPASAWASIDHPQFSFLSGLGEED